MLGTDALLPRDSWARARAPPMYNTHGISFRRVIVERSPASKQVSSCMIHHFHAAAAAAAW